MPEGHRADLRSTESRLDGFGSRLFEFTHIPLLLEASHAVKSANLWGSTKIDCRPTSLIRMRYVGLAQHNMLVMCACMVGLISCHGSSTIGCINMSTGCVLARSLLFLRALCDLCVIRNDNDIDRVLTPAYRRYIRAGNHIQLYVLLYGLYHYQAAVQLYGR